ncbi:MAG TPA: non-heme iron oxygenase ferredoxin subunit [Pyrinomonadaceae bacterium]|nr:non-heme iron oxygenase ferredoxin subunit [Pyrinomonadaceae bacterium]
MTSFTDHPEPAANSESASHHEQEARATRQVPAGLVEDLRPGQIATVETPDGDELALYNVNGELYATENFCPHRGAPLSEGFLCGHVIECGLHGWQFDVRTGRCLTLEEKIKTFPVLVEDDVIQIEIPCKR